MESVSAWKAHLCSFCGSRSWRVSSRKHGSSSKSGWGIRVMRCWSSFDVRGKSMPDIVEASVPAGVSAPRLKLANCLREVTSPQTILAASSSGATERLQRLVDRYRTLLASLDLLKSLETVVRSQSVSARFMLIHSSFEFLLARLENDPERKRADHDYLTERVKLICIAPLLASRAPFRIALRKRFLLKPVPVEHTNLILDLRAFGGDELVVTA